MNASDKTTEQPQPTRRPCLVDGCSCKDARIVSRRRTAFFAARARQAGQTADRIVPIDAGWILPGSARGATMTASPAADPSTTA